MGAFVKFDDLVQIICVDAYLLRLRSKHFLVTILSHLTKKKTWKGGSEAVGGCLCLLSSQE